MDSNHLLFQIMPTLTMFVNAGIMGPIGFIFGFAIYAAETYAQKKAIHLRREQALPSRSRIQ